MMAYVPYSPNEVRVPRQDPGHTCRRWRGALQHAGSPCHQIGSMSRPTETRHWHFLSLSSSHTDPSSENMIFSILNVMHNCKLSRSRGRTVFFWLHEQNVSSPEAPAVLSALHACLLPFSQHTSSARDEQVAPRVPEGPAKVRRPFTSTVLPGVVPQNPLRAQPSPRNVPQP